MSLESINLEFINLKYPATTDTKESDCILKNVSGHFKSGRLCAILGPSGAGKSSLLNILSGFKTRNVSGLIKINGTKRNIHKFRKISSYITQETAILKNMTVLETMMISADLKLGFQKSKYIKLNLINDILDKLHLIKCSQTRVENLSGGEMKRLSIGIELITDPPIMFCDEPTSGLDSVSSVQIITHLRKLTHSGRLIICSIHQPSSKLFELFDDLYILSDGECLYNGPLDELVTVFSDAGFNCPNYYNRADFILEVASRQLENDVEKLIITNRYRVDEKDESDETTNLVPMKASGLLHFNETFFQQEYSVSFMAQFLILTKRHFTCLSRDFIYSKLRILSHIIMALLLGLVYYDIGNDATKVLSNLSCIYFVLIIIFFAIVGPTILIVPMENAVFLREHLNNWYSVRAYYLSKFIGDLPIQVLCVFLFTSITYYMTGQIMEFQRFIKFYAICQMTAMLSQHIGLFFGTLFTDINLAIIVMVLFFIPMSLLCGFFIKLNEMSAVYLKPFVYLSFVRHGYEGCLQTIYGQDRPAFECTEVFCYFKSPKKLLIYLDMNVDRFIWNLTALKLWIFLFKFLVFLAMKRKVRKFT